MYPQQTAKKQEDFMWDDVRVAKQSSIKNLHYSPDIDYSDVRKKRYDDFSPEGSPSIA